MKDLLRCVPLGDEAKAAIVRRLCEPHRKYHNLDHVLEMWRWHKLYWPDLSNDTAVQVVASFCLYHDAVYDPQGKDNEWQSAQLWHLDAQGSIGDLVHNTVDRAILCSRDHFASRAHCDDVLINWCLNLDLLRLGTPEPQFIQHGQDIRAEYAHLSDEAWLKASAQFRAKVMAQPTIFQFPEFHAFEPQARCNLAHALLRDWQELGYLSSHHARKTSIT